MDTKRTFQIQNIRIKKGKIGMLWVLKIYFKIYNHFKSGKNEIPLRSWLITCAVKRDAQVVFCKGFYFFFGISHSPRTPLGHAHR